MAKKIINTNKISYEEWLDLRRRGIGGSDSSAVVGMNPYSGPLTLYANKTGMSKPLEDNEAMRLGRDLEEYVAMRFTEQTGKGVRNDHIMYADDVYPFLTANIDRRVVGEHAGLECKTMGSFGSYNFEKGEVPENYFCQCQHYMMVMGWDRVYLAILVLQRGLYVIPIERNEEFIEELRQAEVEFWQTYVEPNVMPVPDGDTDLDTLKELYPTAKAESEIVIENLDDLVLKYKLFGELAKDYESKKASVQGEICKALGDNEVGIGETYSCSWKNQSKSSVDTKMLKERFPDVYAQVAKTSDYRVFRTKVVKR